MEGKLKILFIEDVQSDVELIWHELKENNISFSKLLVDNKVDYLNSLISFEPDLIISDFSLPQFDGMEALLIRNKTAPLIPFILVTESVNEEVAVDCMKAGADDYVLKDNLSRLGPSVINSINKIKILKEKKAAEKELERSNLRLQKTQTIAHIGNWELDLSAKSIWVSDEALKIYGFENASYEIPLETVQKIPLPEYRLILDEAFDRLLKYNEQYQVEFKIKRLNDGAIRTIYSRADLELTNEGQVKFLGVIQDITDRKQAKEALIESENKYHRIFNNILDVYYETSLEGIILDVSPSIEIVSKGQYHPEDIIGRSMYDFYSDHLVREAIVEALKKDGSINDFEIILIIRDGTLIPCSISAKMTFDVNGNPEKIIGSLRNITERKKVEEELIRAKDKAEESDRLKTAFLHNISHEIRTPMNAIVGFSTLLSEPDGDVQSRQSYTEVIMQSSDHLLSIITDIVDISNIEANLVKAVKNDVNVNTILKSVFNKYCLQAARMNLELSFFPDLSDSDAVILTDGTKLTQILSNLVNNAFKFTAEGFIRFGYLVKNDFLEFYVTDTGIGIPEEHYSLIFDRFYKVENSKSSMFEGTGLGLAISKAYVELIGGRIWVSSEVGTGSSFFFTIPFHKQNTNVENMTKDSVQQDYDFPERITILVAEDVDSNFKLIQFFLSKSNVNILRAKDGKEAVAKVSSEKIDLVLMDIKMPVMDGYMATKIIRETNKNIPIIAQTAYADDNDAAMGCGCSSFISKPFDRHGLLKAIKVFF
jgi:PAS domain S-box-containing protein